MARHLRIIRAQKGLQLALPIYQNAGDSFGADLRIGAANFSSQHTSANSSKFAQKPQECCQHRILNAVHSTQTSAQKLALSFEQKSAKHQHLSAILSCSQSSQLPLGCFPNATPEQFKNHLQSVSHLQMILYLKSCLLVWKGPPIGTNNCPVFAGTSRILNFFIVPYGIPLSRISVLKKMILLKPFKCFFTFSFVHK